MRQQDKSTLLKPNQRTPKWLLIDANGKTLGRLASEIAKVLRGKHRPDYTPAVDCGDGIVVINAEKVRLSGAKEAQKIYREYTGHIGGMKEIPFRVMLQRHPTEILRRAVSGMMPSNRLTPRQMKRLRLFVGPEHDMQAQTPLPVAL
jgi:large subunit ribosomal protein L13